MAVSPNDDTTGWLAEPVGKLGGVRGEAVMKLLNAAQLDDISILVRETCQNSWDARFDPSKAVEVTFGCWTLNDSQTINFRNLFSAGFDEQLFESEDLRSFHWLLKNPEPKLLMVRDVNCHGLDGPIRADQQVDGAKNRYVKFLLDIGGSLHSEGDGGSFGFGRSITYRVSTSRFILIYTRTTNEAGQLESRFVGSLMSGSHTLRDGTQTSGRHWWGEVRDGFCAPITGKRADEIAASLGIDRYSRSERGTTIVVVDPVVRDDTSSAMNFIADSLVWNLWPKMIPATDGFVPMKFKVTHEGEKISIKNPLTTFPISEFASALSLVHGARAGKTKTDKKNAVGSLVRTVALDSPKVIVGHLGLRKFVVPNNRPSWATLTNGETYSASPFESAPHHVAVMRTPELVVRYQAYGESPDDNFSWCGVFRASDDCDEHFRKAEPSTHDLWNKMNVANPQGRRIVGTALSRIRKFVSDFAQEMTPQPTGAIGGVRALAQTLGAAFDFDVQRDDSPRPGRRIGGERTGRVELVVGSPQMRIGRRGRHELSCSVDFATKRTTRQRVKANIAVGVVEGDDPRLLIEPSLVSILSAKDRSGRNLWNCGSKNEEQESSIELVVESTQFPITIVLRREIEIEVMIEAQGVIN